MIMRNLLAASLLCGIALTLSAQQAIAPPSKPADSGPSLDATFKFIQDKLNNQGSVYFAAYWQDSQSNQTDPGAMKQYTDTFSQFTFDSGKCRYAYHRTYSFSQGTYQFGPLETIANIPLGQIAQIKVESADSWFTQEAADEGAPTFSVHVQPSVFIMHVVLNNSQRTCFADGKTVPCAPPSFTDRYGDIMVIRDKDTADRLAKAITHASELCGGGNKEPF